MFNSTQIKRVRDVFVLHEGDGPSRRGRGVLYVSNLRPVLRALALFPSEWEILVLIQTHDPEAVGSFSFDAFLALVQAQYQNETQKVMTEDTTTLDAFVALGGNRDRSGVISADRLRAVIQNELMLPIQIDRLIKEVDLDGSGFIDYEEFKIMMRE